MNNTYSHSHHLTHSQPLAKIKPQPPLLITAMKNKDMMDLEKEILQKAKDAIYTSIISSFNGYNNPLKKIVDTVI